MGAEKRLRQLDRILLEIMNATPIVNYMAKSIEAGHRQPQRGHGAGRRPGQAIDFDRLGPDPLAGGIIR